MAINFCQAQIEVVKDIHPSNQTYPSTPNHELPRGFWGGYQLGDYLYFNGDDSIHGNEPWITDGTPEGTFMIADLYPGIHNKYHTGVSTSYAQVSNYLFQRAADTTKKHSIWVYDISDPGHPLVHKKLFPDSLNKWTINSKMIAFKDHIYFAASDRGVSGSNEELWRADHNSLELFADINTSLPYRGSSPSHFFVYKDHLYFRADNEIDGPQLWRTDGQTVELFKIFNQDGDFQMSGQAILNGEWIFTAYDGPPNGTDQHGYSLWKSDGTAAGTKIIYDFPNDVDGQSIQGSHTFVEYNGQLYFWASDSIHGFELWRTDGTMAGTQMLKDMEPGITSSNQKKGRGSEGILHGVVLGGTLYFRRFGDQIRNWKTDGTANGTMDAQNEWIGSYLLNSYAGFPIEYQGKYIGTSLIGVYNPNEVIWSDGTAQAQVLEELMPGEDPAFPSRFWRLGDKLLFSAQDPLHGFELRIVDLNAVSIDPEQKSSLRLYPNPNQGVIFLESERRISEIILLDTNGKMLQKFPILGYEAKLKLPDFLPNGLYLLQIRFPVGESVFQKIIKS